MRLANWISYEDLGLFVFQNCSLSGFYHTILPRLQSGRLSRLTALLNEKRRGFVGHHNIGSCQISAQVDTQLTKLTHNPHNPFSENGTS